MTSNLPESRCPDCGARVLVIFTEFGSRKTIDPEPATTGPRPWVRSKTRDFATPDGYRPCLERWSRDRHGNVPRYREHRLTCGGAS